MENTQSLAQSHNPSRPPTVVAEGVGGGGSGSGSDGGSGGEREAMMMPTNGTTWERLRSIVPIMRAMVGSAREPQMRRPRLEFITRIASGAAIAPKSL